MHACRQVHAQTLQSKGHMGKEPDGQAEGKEADEQVRADTLTILSILL